MMTEQELIKLQSNAQKGNPESQFELGLIYLKHTKNKEKGLSWLNKSADNGNPDALDNLGIIYEDGRYGIEQNIPLAVDFYIRAFNHGSKNAEGLIAGLINVKQVTGLEYKNIFDFCQKRAEEQQGEYYYLLAKCYKNGIGTEKDLETAIELLFKAQKLNHEDSIIELADMFYDGTINTAFYIPEDKRQKMSEVLYCAAIKLNEKSRALVKLGSIAYAKKDYDLSFRALNKFANNVSKFRINELILFHYLGIGTKKDIDTAIKLCQETIAESDLSANYTLDILTNLQGRSILTIDNISELDIDNIDEENIGAIQILPSENVDFDSCTLYSIEKYKEIITKINETILHNVPENNGTNELEIFLRICKNIISYIKYDDELPDKEKKDISITETTIKDRNLLGILSGTTVCAGFAEILRNVLALRSIECISLSGGEHRYNQVKINGIWYITDLTVDRDNLLNNEPLNHTLIGGESLPIMNAFQTIKPTPESLDRKIIEDTLNKINNENNIIKK